MIKVFEQEMASIMKFVIDQAGGPAPYYWDVPSHFVVPSVYFPMPEIETGGETFSAYNMDHAWFVKIFHRTKEEAYAIGHAVISEIRAARNLIPMIAEDGSEIKGNWIRLDDPKLKILDDGAAQLTITWRSRRPYNDAAAEAQRSQAFYMDMFMKSGKTISDAYAEALEKYAVPLNPNGTKPE